MSPPQNKSSRMISQQLLLLSPHPFLPEHPLPQMLKRSRIQISEQQLPPPKIELLETQLFPHPLSHPHPQFVAVKSLMFIPPGIIFTIQYYAVLRKSVTAMIEKFHRGLVCHIPIPDWGKCVWARAWQNVSDNFLQRGYW